ncbi:MAG TPA: hypothetical protein DEF62_02320 [Porphyromonas gingivalis]|nr:hypothetical protein EG14_08935 [Porphyromonas gingivalis]HBW77928.1 hypothetical protein [Porphyromonas gingivalis]
MKRGHFMNRTYPNRLSESKIYGEVYGLLLNEIQSVTNILTDSDSTKASIPYFPAVSAAQ